MSGEGPVEFVGLQAFRGVRMSKEGRSGADQGRHPEDQG